MRRDKTKPTRPGRYRGTTSADLGTDPIRILVLREMPEAEQNLVWNLFSGDQKRIATAFQRLQPRVQSWSSLLNKLMSFYGLEGIAMPYTMEDFKREVERDILRELTPEQRLQGLSPEQLLSQVPLADIENYLRKQKATHDTTSPEPPKP